MSNLPFLSIVQKEGGTQFKLIVEFPGGGQALFKPMKFTREQVCFFVGHRKCLSTNPHPIKRAKHGAL